MPRSVDISISQPTINTVYARSARESNHPVFWKRLIGAWAPGLGHIGLSTQPDLVGTNNGTLVSMVSASWLKSDGRMSIDLDGVADEVTIPISSKVAGAPNTNLWTISFWLNWDSSDANVVAFRDNSSAGGTGTFFPWDSSGNIRFRLGGTDSSAGSAISGFQDRWVLYTLTNDSSTGRLYTDGIEETTGGVGGSVLGSPWHVGKNGNTAGQFIKGSFDDILMWDRVLSANEVQELYRLGRGGIFQPKPIILGKQRAAAVAGGFIPMRRKRIRYEILHNRG